MAAVPEQEQEKRGFGAAAEAEVPPVAHSIVEERLYLLMVRCPCGAGPLRKVSQALARSGRRTIDLVRARCPRCDLEREFRFDVTQFFGRFYPRRGVSDTDEPSQLLDAVAWARWASLYMEAFEGRRRRRLSHEERIDCGVLALRCLDEALKLFRPHELRPREEDLHTDGSREALAESPAAYERFELIGLKLAISMMLAAHGIDPDGRDPGAPEPGVSRLIEAVRRAGAQPPALPAPPAHPLLPAPAGPRPPPAPAPVPPAAAQVLRPSRALAVALGAAALAGAIAWLIFR